MALLTEWAQDNNWENRPLPIPSAGAMPESGATPLVGTGEFVLLRRSSAEDIIRHWSEQATYFRRLTAGYRNCGDTRGAAVAADTATIYEVHSEKIQRLLDAAILRQPQENSSSQRTRHPMPDHQPTEATTQEQRPGSL